MDERRKILDMLENGSINAQEAARLLDCLGAGARQAAPAAGPATQVSAEGKKLRVNVNGFTDVDKKINVNIGVPLVLARFANNIIENCVPQSALDEMRDKGFDLSKLNLGELIETFETLDEDIVNVDLNQNDADLKVRVYVE